MNLRNWIAAACAVVAWGTVQAEVGVEGLYQTIYSGAKITTGNPAESGVVVPGALFACTNNGSSSLTWVVNGTSYKMGSNQTAAYKGVMKMLGGVTYNFVKNFDDNGYINIVDLNGTTNAIINSETYNAQATGSYTPDKTGWYELDLRVGNGTGGIGPTTNPFRTPLYAGLAWNTNGLTSCTTSNYTEWHRFINDETEGTYLYTALPDPDYPVLADDCAVAYAGSSVTLSVKLASGKADLYALATDTDGQDITALLAQGVEPSETATTGALSGLVAGKSYRIGVRFVTAAGSEGEYYFGVIYTGALTLTVTANADVATSTPGAFVVTRPDDAEATAYDLEVPYTISGATAGVNYLALSGSVTIPAGETSATVSVYPIWSGSDDVTMTIALAANTHFALGSPASGTLVIAGAAMDPLVRYVATDGSDTANSGLTADAPFATISNAVAALASTLPAGRVGTVYLAAGTYSELCPATDYTAGQSSYTLDGGATSNLCGWSCLELKYPIRLVGQTGNPADVTIKRKNNTGRVLFLDNAESSVENVTVTGGTGGYTGSNRYTSGAWGSNVYISPNGGTVSNCVISSGAVTYYGTNGGNLMMKGGRVVRTKIVAGSGHAGALYADGGVIENCLITGNKTDEANGVVNLKGTAKLVNCTVAGNTGSAASGGVKAEGNASVVNCAIFENTAATDSTGYQHVWCGTASCFDHCAGDVLINDNCFAGASGFVDSANGDYSLGASSVCVDNGTDYAGTAALCGVDFVGFKRVSGAAVDIGAFEMDADALAVDFSWNVASGISPVEVVFTAAPNGVTGTAEYRWDFDGDGVVDAVTSEPSVTHTYDSPGRYTVMVTLASNGSTAAATHASCIVVAAADLYVDAANAANAAYPYDSWACATTNIAEALSNALDGVTVHVKGGSYKAAESYLLDKGVRIIGESGEARDVLISGTGPIFTLNHPNAFVSGVTVTNVYIYQYPKAAGFYVKTLGGTISNCVVTGCWAAGYYPRAIGASLETGVFTHSLVENCWYSGTGGEGLRCTGARADGDSRVENCLFRNFDETDSKRYGGSVLGCTTDSAIVRNCTVVGMRSKSYSVNGNVYLPAAALYADKGTIENCVAADALATSNVVTYVEAVDAESGELVVDTETGLVVTNTVKTTVTYNAACFRRAGAFSYCATDTAEAAGDHCVVGTAATFFKDYAGGDLRPAPSSPLRNAGLTPASVVAVDFGGDPRLVGSAIDIGCYEATSMGLTVILR